MNVHRPFKISAGFIKHRPAQLICSRTRSAGTDLIGWDGRYCAAQVCCQIGGLSEQSAAEIGGLLTTAD